MRDGEGQRWLGDGRFDRRATVDADADADAGGERRCSVVCVIILNKTLFSSLDYM